MCTDDKEWCGRGVDKRPLPSNGFGFCQCVHPQFFWLSLERAFMCDRCGKMVHSQFFKSITQGVLLCKARERLAKLNHMSLSRSI